MAFALLQANQAPRATRRDLRGNIEQACSGLPTAQTESCWAPEKHAGVAGQANECGPLSDLRTAQNLRKKIKVLLQMLA
jgi:hypothetical protein